MNKRQTERRERLLPGGKPRWIRCYDNGGKTIDRYTVVFTNLKIPNYYPYIALSGAPFHPQGFFQHGEAHDKPVDYPTYGHLGKRIQFDDLPDGCQTAVMRDYLDLWGLEACDG